MFNVKYLKLVSDFCSKKTGLDIYRVIVRASKNEDGPSAFTASNSRYAVAMYVMPMSTSGHSDELEHDYSLRRVGV